MFIELKKLKKFKYLEIIFNSLINDENVGMKSRDTTLRQLFDLVTTSKIKVKFEAHEEFEVEEYFIKSIIDKDYDHSFHTFSNTSQLLLELIAKGRNSNFTEIMLAVRILTH